MFYIPVGNVWCLQFSFYLICSSAYLFSIPTEGLEHNSAWIGQKAGKTPLRVAVHCRAKTIQTHSHWGTIYQRIQESLHKEKGVDLNLLQGGSATMKPSLETIAWHIYSEKEHTEIRHVMTQNLSVCSHGAPKNTHYSVHPINRTSFQM